MGLEWKQGQKKSEDLGPHSKLVILEINYSPTIPR